MMLTSDRLYNDLGEVLITHYENLATVDEKIDFVHDIQLSAMD